MKITELIANYIRHLRTIGRAKLTIRNVKSGLNTLVKFLKEENINYAHELTKEVMAEYQQELAFKLTSKGTPLTLQSQCYLLGHARNFTKYLVEQDVLIHDPSSKLRLPKPPKRLPKVILSSTELKQLMNSPDVQSNRGYRNRVILEVLYDTGIRRAEVCNIKLHDLDLEGGYIHIRSGKGDKDRVVPLSTRVCNLIKSYLVTIRPTFLQGKDDGYFILNRWGKRTGANSIGAVVKRCLSQSGIKKNISTHTFRHTCATHMLKHGAPIRHVQELLGHACLETTQIYTHVTINDLKKVHAKYHPGESLPAR